MHFLVTGGAGFIGSHLVESLLADDHEVTIFDDFNDYYDPRIKRHNVASFAGDIRVVEGDIRDAVLVERTFAGNSFDCVVHLAARAGVRPSISDPKLYLTTNIDGTFNLLDACLADNRPSCEGEWEHPRLRHERQDRETDRKRNIAAAVILGLAAGAWAVARRRRKAAGGTDT